jgi:hypothetical protein
MIRGIHINTIKNTPGRDMDALPCQVFPGDNFLMHEDPTKGIFLGNMFFALHIPHYIGDLMGRLDSRSSN